MIDTDDETQPPKPVRRRMWLDDELPSPDELQLSRRQRRILGAPEVEESEDAFA